MGGEQPLCLTSPLHCVILYERGLLHEIRYRAEKTNISQLCHNWEDLFLWGKNNCIYAYINLARAGIKMHGKGENILLFCYLPLLGSHSFGSPALRYKWMGLLPSETHFYCREISWIFSGVQGLLTIWSFVVLDQMYLDPWFSGKSWVSAGPLSFHQLTCVC